MLDFVNSMNRRKAYFVMDTIRNSTGEIIPCIAVEGVAGYYQTDWTWGKSLSQAEKIAVQMNERLGVSVQDADAIVLSTMKNVIFS